MTNTTRKQTNKCMISNVYLLKNKVKQLQHRLYTRIDLSRHSKWKKPPLQAWWRRVLLFTPMSERGPYSRTGEWWVTSVVSGRTPRGRTPRGRTPRVHEKSSATALVLGVLPWFLLAGGRRTKPVGASVRSAVPKKLVLAATLAALTNHHSFQLDKLVVGLELRWVNQTVKLICHPL